MRTALIWDLGYTLVEPDCFAVAQDIGYDNCLYLQRTYGALNQEMLNGMLAKMLSEGDAARYATVKELPQLVRDWFAGFISDSEMLAKALKRIQAAPNFDGQERELVQSILRWIFTPDLFAKSIQPKQNMVSLLEKCSKTGSSRYVLSNWDRESFLKMYQRPELQVIFKHFASEHIYASGLIGYVKPDPAIYHYLLEREKLNPKDCIFIDDQKNNVDGAIKCGMQAIHFEHNDAYAVEKQLIERGVLSSSLLQEK